MNRPIFHPRIFPNLAIHVCFGFSLCLVGLQGAENPIQGNSPLQAGQPIFDHGLFHYLQKEGKQMLEDGLTLTNLAEHLDSKQTLLTLRRPYRLKRSTEKLARKAESSVVVVGKMFLCGNCSRTHLSTASGFLISSDGAMVTSHHVLEDDNTLGLVALTRDGQVCPVKKVLAADPLNDLVILQIEGDNFKALPISDDAPIGAPVHVISHPSRNYYMLTSGQISRYYTRRTKTGESLMMTITAKFARGSSGGPVLDERGNVVGIANNTRSIYYETEGDQQNDFQMTLFNTTPAKALLDMIDKP